MTIYPLTSTERDRWILERRPARNRLDPFRPYAFFREQETEPDGSPVDVTTILLTNRECPYRCLMCDLWRNTLEETVPEGAIAAQIRHALEALPPTSPSGNLKLYNAGSFFDRRAIPPSEYSEIARLAASFDRVIVECHPAFAGPACLAFGDMLAGRLEVAMGLETVHPAVLERLNKRMTLEQFRRAAGFLVENGIALRVFILLRPPWLSEAEGVDWARRSLDFAFDCGASVCAVIPTRPGNGAMEELARSGEWSPPSLPSLEAAVEYGLSLRRGRVFADLWDIERFARCPACSEARVARLRRMNERQQPQPTAPCAACGGKYGK